MDQRGFSNVRAIEKDKSKEIQESSDKDAEKSTQRASESDYERVRNALVVTYMKMPSLNQLN